MNRIFTYLSYLKHEKVIATFCMCFLLMSSIHTKLLAQSPPLACNDRVQVSLDEKCEAGIEMDMVIEGNRNDYDDLRLDVKDLDGKIILTVVGSGTGLGITGEYLQQDLPYQVTHVGGNSCWGKIWIEDHIPPTVECKEQVISCANSTFPGDPVVGRYKLNIFSFNSYTITNFGDSVELEFTTPFLGNKKIDDVRLLLQLEDIALSTLSGAIRNPLPSNSTLSVFENPLKDNDDMNCLDNGIWAIFNDWEGLPNEDMADACRLLTTPSINGVYHSLDTISNFKGVDADGTWTVILKSSDGSKINQSSIKDIYLELVVAEDYINIPVWNPNAEFTYLGDNSFQIDSLGYCGASYAEWEDEFIEGCAEYDGNQSIYDGLPIMGKILRTWTVKDPSGNTATCVDTIFLKQSLMKDIIMPPNFDDNDWPAFDCPSEFAHNTLPNGAPHPDITGYPYDSLSINKILCSNMQTAWEDQIIYVENCGSSFKVIRNWTVLDWCHGETYIDYQIIKVVDDVEPALECQEDIEVYMDANPYKCGVDFEVPAPKVISECNDYTWTVEYIITDEEGECIPPASDEEYIRDNVYHENGKVIIRDIPLGCTWIKYIVTDECGNVSDGKCRVEVKVKDNIPPVPICDEVTTVAVSIDGYAYLHATSLDDGSWDNCMVDRFGVAKMTDVCHDEKDEDFQAEDDYTDKVKFCCEEVGETIMVRLRVWDKSDNYNDCMVSVVVQDKIPPVIDCPDDITLECQADFKNLELTGEAGYLDNCIVNEPSFADTEYLDQCGIGEVYRVWTVTDQAGFKVSCTQHIELRDFDPFEMEDRDFPEDIELVECTSSTNPEITGSPNLDDDDKCSLVAATYKDQVFSFVDEACRKIIREWTVIDWCQFESESDCVDPDLIDETATCTAEYEPVCGCNGITYANACEAEKFGGVKDWIPGPCNASCKNPLNLSEILDNFGDYTGDSELREVQYDEEFYYVLIDSLNCYDLLDPWTIHSDTLVYSCQGELLYEYGENDDEAPWAADGLPSGRVIWDCEGLPEGSYVSETGIPGLWRKTQVIKINNYEAPTMTSSCEDITLCSFGPSCGGEVELKASATDDCTPEDELVWHYKIYKDGEGFPYNPYFVGHGPDASGYYPDGKHRIVWTVEDQCGNTTLCDYEFTVVDCKEPVPYCLTSLTTVVMPSNGTVEVWAIDFDHGSEDNCTVPEKLKFSFSDDTDDRSREFDCADLPDGKSATFSMELWVTDEEGNQDYCDVQLEIQDNAGDFCQDVEVVTASVSGFVRTEDNLNIHDAIVEISGNLPEFPLTLATSDIGSYTFENLPVDGTYELSVEKDDDLINGVSTLDLVFIQKHILGLNLLNSSYKVIAADADNNGRVSAADLIHLRKLILGVENSLPNGQKAWRFINATSDISNNGSIFPIDETIRLQSLSGNKYGMNFMGIKTGDINGNAKVNGNEEIEIRSDKSVDFVMLEPSENMGVVEVPVSASHFQQVVGFQFTLEFETHGLRYQGLKPGLLEMDDSNIGQLPSDNQVLTMSWNSSTAMSANSDDVLFTLIFDNRTGDRISELVEMNSTRTTAEAYDESYRVMHTSLSFRNKKQDIGAAFELMQNTPNPFSQQTTIGFSLPNSSNATLKVFDVTGKTLYRLEAYYAKGYNEVILDRNELKAHGVLYYTLETGQFTDTKKMLGIE